MSAKVAIDGFTALLDDLIKNTKLTPQFILNLGQCYSSMDLHAKAIDLLSKYPKPKPDDLEAEKLHKASQLMLLREMRLGGAMNSVVQLSCPASSRWGRRFASTRRSAPAAGWELPPRTPR